LTRQEAATMLGLRPQTLAVWAMTGRNLPYVKLGGKVVRYRREDVEAFIDKCRIGVPSPPNP
jgi:excisionase family DNA binding protein